MKEIKIKNIEIKGIRGIKETLVIPLEEKSIIVYGDNGTGKSSISDSLEWYLKDEVRHLSSSEIDLKDALRNSNLLDAEGSSTELKFSSVSLNSQKSLSLIKGKFISKHSNSSDDFNNYLNITLRENILLRYEFLTEFIDKTKGDKLKSLSDVIGFSEVNKIKEVLKKAFNSVKSDIKNQNFENQINTQKGILKEKIGAVVSIEQNLLQKINEIIKPLKIDVELKIITDIDVLLDKLKTPINNPLLTELKFLETCINIFNTLRNESGLLNSEYEKYYTEFNSIAGDVQAIMQTFLAELLKAGHSVLERKYHKEDTCPLCLQLKNKDDLILEIQKRLKEIEESSKKKMSFDNAQQTILKIADERIRRIEFLNNEALIKESSNSNIQISVNTLITRLKSYSEAGNAKVTSGKKIKEPAELLLNGSDFEIIDEITKRISTIKMAFESDSTTTIYSNISAAKDAFIRIKKFEIEKEKLEVQLNSLENIYNEFVKKQKEALESFISAFSGTINEYYQFMNPGEQFDEIKIVTIGDADELEGITIEYKYNGEWVSPPQKYFSESHLNCFGISFFLASVKAFNIENKFIVLDDIISSFDTNHRKRFADLLLEKFEDYQIILLTHEINWFEYIRNAVKNKNWIVKTVKWSDAKGTYFDETTEGLKVKIESKIINSNTDKLGNDIREYLENILKDISRNLEVRVKFQFNDKNEDRMTYELLSDLKGRISKSAEFSKYNPLFDRTLASTFIGNKDSHDSSYTPSMGDLKAFWKDVQDIESLFYCKNCNTAVQFKYYDETAKNIKCKCGSLKYDFKR